MPRKKKNTTEENTDEIQEVKEIEEKEEEKKEKEEKKTKKKKRRTKKSKKTENETENESIDATKSEKKDTELEEEEKGKTKEKNIKAKEEEQQELDDTNTEKQKDIETITEYPEKVKQDVNKLNELDEKYSYKKLCSLTKKELIKLCLEFGTDKKISELENLTKDRLILETLIAKSKSCGFDYIVGVLEPIVNSNNGIPTNKISYGFLRLRKYNYATSPEDVYIAGTQIRKFGLKKGDLVAGPVRDKREREHHKGLAKIDAVNWVSPEEIKNRPNFDELTPTYPTEKFNLETSFDGSEQTDLTLRVIDLFTPIGKGQRGLIVAPPRTGKTTILQKIAKSIVKNHPEVKLIVLLVDERPEEVTEMREIVPTAEVISSTFDESPEHHIQVSEIVIEYAKRQVEFGKDVVILLDSITRMTRAYNVSKMESSGSSKILSGGLDAFALRKPKQFFGAARNIRGGGSLTIISTALINTGSRMDDVIYEEFKGTGNMEMVLDRNLADRRMFPAIDINLSGTRREELLLEKSVLGRMFIVRKVLNEMPSIESMETLLKRLKRTKNNKEFLRTLQINV